MLVRRGTKHVLFSVHAVARWRANSSVASLGRARTKLPTRYYPVGLGVRLIDFDLARQLSRYDRIPPSYGVINTQTLGDLRLLSYGREAQTNNIWTPAEQLCRGIIINAVTGEIVALPFTKFFNYGQRMATSECVPSPDASLAYVMEKKDGSLGILYRYQGQYRIATRGSFTSDQAIWATNKLSDYRLDSIPLPYTLCFEIVYPDNQIVVDYGETAELFLLGGFDRFTGRELSLAELQAVSATTGFIMPAIYTVTTYDEAMAFVNQFSGREFEGVVMVYDDGSRFKVKGDQYLTLQKLLCQLSPSRIGKLWVEDNLPTSPVVPNVGRSTSARVPACGGPLSGKVCGSRRPNQGDYGERRHPHY